MGKFQIKNKNGYNKLIEKEEKRITPDNPQ